MMGYEYNLTVLMKSSSFKENTDLIADIFEALFSTSEFVSYIVFQVVL